jgi:hypothetical protein
VVENPTLSFTDIEDVVTPEAGVEKDIAGPGKPRADQRLVRKERDPPSAQRGKRYIHRHGPNHMMEGPMFSPHTVILEMDLDPPHSFGLLDIELCHD